MRGSPLIRFILLAIALTATAAGLMRITNVKQASGGALPPLDATVRTDARFPDVPFRLVLSAPATLVEINARDLIRPTVSDSPISGTIKLDGKNPQVALIVRWKSPVLPGEHRFAKLTLEAPGQPTFTHVFDADGDIDDFLELPFPVEK